MIHFFFPFCCRGRSPPLAACFPHSSSSPQLVPEFTFMGGVMPCCVAIRDRTRSIASCPGCSCSVPSVHRPSSQHSYRGISEPSRQHYKYTTWISVQLSSVPLGLVAFLDRALALCLLESSVSVESFVTLVKHGLMASLSEHRGPQAGQHPRDWAVL